MLLREEHPEARTENPGSSGMGASVPTQPTAVHRGPRDPGPAVGDASIPTWFEITAGALAPAAVAAFFPVSHTLTLALIGVAGVMLVTGLVMVLLQHRRS
jgi:hypothetical protein